MEEAALEFDGHRRRALHDTAATAIRAVGVEIGRQTLLLALAGHLHNAELRDRENVVLGFVGGHQLDHLFVNGVPVTPFLHVDEIHDDQTAEISEADLAGDLGGGLKIHGVDDVFLVAAAVLVGAGVHVDGDEGLGLVDDDFTAGGKGNLALAGLLDLPLDVEALKDRDAVLVERDLAGGAF